MFWRIVLMLALLWLSGERRLHGQTEPAEPDRTAIAIEALSRLKGMDLEANPSLKSAVMNVLTATRGTPNFVKIVQDFHLSGQDAGLLEVAQQHPAEEAGVEAMRLVLADKDSASLTGALHGTNAARTIEALGNTHEQQMVPLLLPLLSDDKVEANARRQAVRSLAQVQAGASAVLQLAEEGQLPDALKFAATTELNQVRWPELKERAAKVLPLPQSKNTESLPPMGELVQRKGDPARGAEVFKRQEVGCVNCHRVNDQGKDVGPALSEIGTKLGKDALYEAILDPSAGISFGYETWQIELKSGDEAYGLIVSETADELTIKDTKAIPTRIKKGDIVNRRQLKTSLMPAGLQQTMSTQDLVDLVEYLSSLRKATK